MISRSSVASDRPYCSLDRGAVYTGMTGFRRAKTFSRRRRRHRRYCQRGRGERLVEMKAGVGEGTLEKN